MRIEVYHDTVCPWCRIGQRHLELAMARWDGQAPEVHWRPFFLNPAMPDGGAPFGAYLRESKGIADLEPMFEPVRRAGAACGLEFRLEAIERAPNTARSHALIALAPADHQRAVLAAIHRAYFEQGRDIGDPAVLGRIAAESGLDGPATEAALRAGVGFDDTLAAAQAAARLGVTGVPLFVFDGRYALSGAQPPDVLLAAMREVAAARVATAAAPAER